MDNQLNISYLFCESIKFASLFLTVALVEPCICSSSLGKSALHWAAAVNNVEATLVLLKNGANRDMQDNKVSSGAFMKTVANCGV